MIKRDIFPRQCRGPKKNYKRDSPQDSEKIMKMLQDMLVQQQVGGFSVKEMITGRIVSKCNSNECKVNDYVNKTNLLQNESESVEHRSKESIVWEVQSEAMKYFWASSN